ncbi:MAG: hypothetical protein EOP11_16455, partial [Proteobacteria bacterium]
VENLTGKAAPGYTLQAQLYDANDKPILDKPLQRSTDEIINEIHPRLDRVKFGLMEATISNPKKWSTEEPYLYKLLLTLADSTGRVLEVKTCRIGFRSIEFRKDDSKLVINGKLTYLYGVNRPDHHPTRGKALTRLEAGEYHWLFSSQNAKSRWLTATGLRNLRAPERFRPWPRSSG